MAVNSFGDTIEETPVASQTSNVNAFGDIVESATVPIPKVIGPSDYEIFKQQYIAQQQRPTLAKAIERLVAPVKGIGGIVGDLAGIPGGISQAASSETPIATAGRSLVEGARQSGVDIVNLIRNLPEQIIPNPIQMAMDAANLRSRTPSEGEIQKAFQEQQLQQNILRPENQLIQGEVAPKLVQGTRQVIPLALPLVSSEARAAALSPLQTSKSIGRGTLGLFAPESAANLAKNSAPVTLSQLTENALGFTPEEVAQHVPTAVSRVRQIVGNEIPKTAQEGVALLDKTENELYSQRQEINHAADNQGLVVNGNVAVDSAREALDKIKTITQDQKSRILKNVEELYSGDKKPTEGQLVQEQLNAKLKAFYSAEDPLATAQQEADLAVRNSFADQMDQINQAMTGRSETPYSDIGNIIETRNALGKKLDQIRMSEADRKGGIGKGPTKIPTTAYGVKAKGTNAVLSKLQKSQLTKLDEATQRIFSESGGSIVSPEIPPQTLDELMKSKSSTQPSLDRKITDLIKTYPKDIQKNPALARKVAEAQLGISP